MAEGVDENDRGLRRILRNFRGKREIIAKIGVQRGEGAEPHEGGGLTNAELAAIHEFGAPKAGIPERPFLRGTFDREEKAWAKLMARAADRVADGKDPETEIGIVAEKALADVIRTIDESLGIKENAPATIAAKGSSRPLIDTGELKQSITAVVERKG